MSKNKLPSSFCVKSDLSHPRWKEFIRWFNDRYHWHFQGTTSYGYYGIDADGSVVCYTHTTGFKNIYSIDEFFNMIEEKPTEEVVSHWTFVPKTDLKKIYDVACNTWKEKIVKYAEREPFDTHSRLSVEEVDEMFNAATKDQKVVLEAVFGTRDKSIDLSQWKLSELGKGFHDAYNRSGLFIRSYGEYENKAFWLNTSYNWEFKTDVGGDTLLVPTRK